MECLDLKLVNVKLTEETKRFERNIKKLEERIIVEQNNGRNENVINVLNREKFNQRRMIHMLESSREETNRPLNVSVLISDVYAKHRKVMEKKS